MIKCDIFSARCSTGASIHIFLWDTLPVQTGSHSFFLDHSIPAETEFRLRELQTETVAVLTASRLAAHLLAQLGRSIMRYTRPAGNLPALGGWARVRFLHCYCQWDWKSYSSQRKSARYLITNECKKRRVRNILHFVSLTQKSEVFANLKQGSK